MVEVDNFLQLVIVRLYSIFHLKNCVFWSKDILYFFLLVHYDHYFFHLKKKCLGKHIRMWQMPVCSSLCSRQVAKLLVVQSSWRVSWSIICVLYILKHNRSKETLEREPRLCLIRKLALAARCWWTKTPINLEYEDF